MISYVLQHRIPFFTILTDVPITCQISNYFLGALSGTLWLVCTFGMVRFSFYTSMANP
jgi:hypothetical protein